MTILLYQGTASDVPKDLEEPGLQPLMERASLALGRGRWGLKPLFARCDGRARIPALIQAFQRIATYVTYPGRRSVGETYRFAGGADGAGFANLAASTEALGCTSLNSVVVLPSNQLTVQRKGILTPETLR